MNKQTVALIALFAAWILTADIANAIKYEDIAGQWCGDVTDYVFTPNTLTVKFHDDRPANVFKITKYTYTDDSVRIDWLNGTKESVTVFAEFGGTRWRSRRTAANRADLSIAAETSSYLEKVGANLRRGNGSRDCSWSDYFANRMMRSASSSTLTEWSWSNTIVVPPPLDCGSRMRT